MQFAFLANSSPLCVLIRPLGVLPRYPPANQLGQNTAHAQCHPLPGHGARRRVAGRHCTGRKAAQAKKSSTTSSTAQTYKWVDEQGVTHYGDSVPAEYSQREQRVLNSQGVEVQKKPGRDDAGRSRGVCRQAERRSAAPAARHVPGVHLSVGQGNRERARQRASNRSTARSPLPRPTSPRSRTRVDGLKQRALIYAPYNTKPGARRMPDDLAEEMVRALSELRTQNSALAQRRTRTAEGRRPVRRRHQALQGTAHLGRGAHQRSAIAPKKQ